MDSTYLEEFLLSIEGMPNDVRRDFELMRDLDRETLDLNRELVELEEKMVVRANSRAEARQPTVLQFNGRLKESGEAVAAASTDGNKEVTPAPPRVGDVHTDAQDPEGAVMLAEINSVRAKISSRLTEKTGAPSPFSHPFSPSHNRPSPSPSPSRLLISHSHRQEPVQRADQSNAQAGHGPGLLRDRSAKLRRF